MGVAYNSRIITDGLVLALDAANNKSILSAVEVLVVGGGGGGGANHAGGGGAGGLIYNSNFAVTPGTQLTVTVGDGGNKSTNYLYTAAGDGSSSVFGSLTAIGGGGGGNRRDGGTAGLEFGRSGGSGGGGGGQGSNNTPTITGGLGTAGQGFDGGTASFHAGAGGGGAGGPGETTNGSDGSSSSTTFPGDGGPGLPFNISGTFTYYAGGGGGGGVVSGPYAGAGGIGGGGNGQIDGTQQVNGEANTGGGGGGSYGNGTAAGGAGGSGIVIVRYPGSQKAIGGTVTSVGGDTIHTFTTSGTFTPTWGDMSNNGNTGTLVNGVGYSASNGGSLVFDGSNQYATVTNGMNFLIGTSSVTFSAWIYRSSAPAYWAGIISNKVNVTEGICLLVNPDSKVFWQYDGGVSGVYAIYGGQSLSTNVWYNIVGVYDNIDLKTYVNGSLNDSANDAGKSISSSGNMNITIGAQDSGPGGPFPGRIANTSIYNKALSAAEIQQNFNATRGRFSI